jgi:hypothetical protein
MKTINTYDIDGVILVAPNVKGLTPGKDDVIITGRSFQDRPETELALKNIGIHNKVIYNELPKSNMSRSASGYHKVEAIKSLQDQGYKVHIHFEDDPIQLAIIQNLCDNVHVILVTEEYIHVLHQIEEYARSGNV